MILTRYANSNYLMQQFCQHEVAGYPPEYVTFVEARAPIPAAVPLHETDSRSMITKVVEIIGGIGCGLNRKDMMGYLGG